MIVDKWHWVDKCYTQLLPAAIAAIKTSTRSKHRARTADSSVAWIVLSGDRHGWYTLHYCESRNKLSVSWSERLSSSELSIRVQNIQSNMVATTMSIFHWFSQSLKVCFKKDFNILFKIRKFASPHFKKPLCIIDNTRRYAILLLTFLFSSLSF